MDLFPFFKKKTKQEKTRVDLYNVGFVVTASSNKIQGIKIKLNWEFCIFKQSLNANYNYKKQKNTVSASNLRRDLEHLLHVVTPNQVVQTKTVVNLIHLEQ